MLDDQDQATAEEATSQGKRAPKGAKTKAARSKPTPAQPLPKCVACDREVWKGNRGVHGACANCVDTRMENARALLPVIIRSGLAVDPRDAVKLAFDLNEELCLEAMRRPFIVRKLLEEMMEGVG